MSVTPREAALNAVSLFRKRGVWPETFLDSLVTSEGMAARDAALAVHIAAGVLGNMTLLDFYLSAFLTRRPEKLEPVVLDILRVSAYQLLFLDRIPAHAAVHEGVELAKKRANPRAAALVNAVLRKLAANIDDLPEIPRLDEAEYLSIRYSHPLWLTKRLLSLLGARECERLLAADNETPPTTLQVNTLKGTTEEAIASLRSDGLAPEEHPFLPDALLLPPSGNVAQTEAFRKGLIYVQDAAAKLAVMAAGPKPGDFVLDGCAAPGGKSFSSAVAMRGEGKILACDLHENKLKKIRDGAERLGITILETLVADGRAPWAGLIGKADCVLADVPCSGLGVIRKKPDIRYKKEADIAALPDIQLAILRGLSACVKPGGTLVYSTCTILPEENENVCRAFLEDNEDFYTEDFTLPGPGEVSGGMVTLWPHIHGTDGFFVCRMRRKR